MRLGLNEKEENKESDSFSRDLMYPEPIQWKKKTIIVNVSSTKSSSTKRPKIEKEKVNETDY